MKYIVIHDVDQGSTFAELVRRTTEIVSSDQKYARIRQMLDRFDGFKLYSVPGSFKSSNRTINLENDETLIVT